MPIKTAVNDSDLFCKRPAMIAECPPVTLFAIPKPFAGHIDVIQRNAIRSWTLLLPRPQVFLFGDETGTAEVADEMGVIHVSDVRRNEWGTPLVNDVFQQARERATAKILAYVNADIILTSDFPTAMGRIAAANCQEFLVIGRRVDVDVIEPINFDAADWQEQLFTVAKRTGTLAPRVCKDYIIFASTMYEDMPSFAIGRGNWDNWMVHRARQIQVPIIEATGGITAIHQNHGYAHLSGNRTSAYVTGPEAKQNQQLAGGRHLVRGSASNWKLTAKGVRRKLLPFPLVQFVADFPRFWLLLMELAGLKARQ